MTEVATAGRNINRRGRARFCFQTDHFSLFSLRQNPPPELGIRLGVGLQRVAKCAAGDHSLARALGAPGPVACGQAAGLLAIRAGVAGGEPRRASLSGSSISI